MTAAYIAPQMTLQSFKACMNSILETYTNRYQQEIEIDLSEDYSIHASLKHLEYAVVHLLKFFHAHQLKKRVTLWITQQEGLHIRLRGQAVSESLVHELFSLFPLKETTRNMGLAIRRVVIEAHGGHLLCKTYSVPDQAYTEFVLVIPPAEIDTRKLEAESTLK